MTKDEMRARLALEMERLRACSYAQLVERIEAGGGKRAEVEIVSGVAPDGSAYGMEFCILWDDRPGGDVRVIGDLSVLPQRPLLGFIPIYTPDVSDDFILSPQGRFVGE